MNFNTCIQCLHDVLFIIDQDEIALYAAGTRQNLTNKNRQRMQERIDNSKILSRNRYRSSVHRVR
jgi:hypothetical protein